MAADRRIRALRERALAVRAWAEGNRLLHAGRLPIAGGPEIAMATTAFAEAAVPAFTRKPIVAVGMNPGRGEDGAVVIYTARPLTAAEGAQAAESFKGTGELLFRVAKPPVLDAAMPAALAAPLPQAGLAGRYPCGSSISLGNVREAGTLGCLVRDAGGVLYGLSANHVTGGCSNARPGAPVVGPGIKDVGAGLPDPRTLGHHARALALVPGDPASVAPGRNRDAAVFRLSDPDALSSSQGGHHDTPAAAAEPMEEAVVEKVGRSTGLTRGVIESQIVGPFPVSYRTTIYHSAEEDAEFRGQVFFEPVYVVRGEGGPFALAGDSGALVTAGTGTARRAVGIVFSGRGAEESYMLPLKPILDDLGMTLVSGHGTSEA
ncbi:hypothetical protein SAMN02799631_00192 [Methylobacterium sp. 174MFSha1.1]|uniref:hypothetical protein n=1 Tax=Methylobacterium sp. 174MFSha1.1 TaxID=1502749 RepID=UPI0008E3F010|nr:hypothetical protein [Methylobacterium sp. 174MFSha1.1]SFU33430.1 hypothetical protein SAMN02799631_00192 [Methylobacterium sp. 174MFSha1.1]